MKRIIAICLALASGGMAVAEPTTLFKKGDRVVFIGNTFADQLRLYGYIETMLAARHPDYGLTFRNLGWSGDTLTLRPRPLNFGSLDDHLTEQKADVIVACFGMNESFAGEDDLQDFRRDWETLIQHLRSQRYNGKEPPRLVMISPILHEKVPGLPDPDEHNKALQLYVEAERDIAQKHKIPFVDLYHGLLRLQREKPSLHFTDNGIHLNRYGYWVASQLIAEQLAPAPLWRVAVDGRAGSLIRAEGTEVVSLEVKGDDLELQIREQRLPAPPPPDRSIHRSLMEKQPLLIITNLKKGTYQLVIEGKVAARATAADWAKGVTVLSSPAHDQSERLRQAIVDKNMLFFHYWRAHNSEYIFGRRAKPFGVVSFPPERKQYRELLKQKDHSLQPLMQPPPTGTWRLSRADD